MRKENGQFMKGYKHSESAKQKMLKRTPWNKGVKNPFSIETINKMKKSHTGKKIHSAEWKEELSKKMTGNKFGVGVIPSKEWRDKHSKRMIGNTFNEGNKNFLGKKHSISSRKKISNSRIGKYAKENHPNWKGGITPYSELIRGSVDAFNWKRKVKERDGYKCRISNQECKGGLEAHHILRFSEYPELRFEVNNGITLCKFHHPKKRKDEARLRPYFTSLINNQ